MSLVLAILAAVIAVLVLLGVATSFGLVKLLAIAVLLLALAIVAPAVVARA